MIERYTGPPMTLGNMPAEGIRCLDVYGPGCHHNATVNVERAHGCARFETDS
jgi:hypothetical protein